MGGASPLPRWFLSVGSLPVVPYCPPWGSLSTCRTGSWQGGTSVVSLAVCGLGALSGHVQAKVGLVAKSHALHRAAGQVQLRGAGRHPAEGNVHARGFVPWMGTALSWESHQKRRVVTGAARSPRGDVGSLGCRVVFVLHPLFEGSPSRLMRLRILSATARDCYSRWRWCRWPEPVAASLVSSPIRNRIGRGEGVISGERR